eukprot:PITA_12315
MFNVYAPVLASEKKICWNSLHTFLLEQNPENIIIAGDLNVTLDIDEKKGGSIVRDPAREWVEDIMLGWDLEDIKLSSGKYTWSNKRTGPNHIAARLDRFLVHSSFLTSGLMASSKILPNLTSDHKPILLELSLDCNLGPIPFRFSPLWIQQEGFQEVVSDSWNRPVHGSPFFVWEEKIRSLKRNLKVWAKRLQTPTSKRKENTDRLAAHQIEMEQIPVSQGMLLKEIELQKEVHRASREEEEYWRQKSRMLWLKSGDKNTSFFHKQAEARKNFKSVSEIQFQNTVIKDFEGIKRAAYSFFQDLYSAPEDPIIDPHSYPLNLIPNCVKDSDNDMLTAPISMEELEEALNNMEPDKAPGPDGFSARFFLTCWSTINKYLLRMVRKSQNCVKIGGGINSSFLALIPKEKGASDFSRFRPISLCNSSYKLVSKIIANRLKNILLDIIPENQGGFIKGRKILDNIVLVQEAVHSSCQRKEKGMVIKLDLANAFDRVRHEFLFAVMKKLGFSTKFINWVKACIASPWIAPLVNGRSTDFFQASRGLRQGCPLSPLLYTVQASVLSFQLDHNQQIQSLPGLRTSLKVKDINHAQFADDTLLLGGANLLSARHFKRELDIYRLISGSKINYRKCSIYGWNCTTKELSDIARLLEMEGNRNWESFKYLGIPIFKTKPKVAHWLPLLDKIKNKIQAWGASWLNNAGKLILMKSVLISMPLFQNSILLAPKTFLSKLDSLLRRFLWEGGNNNDRRIHLVSWEILKSPFQEGGLQLRNLAAQNSALGAKTLWNLVSGKTSWSKRVLWKKYFQGQRLRCLDNPPRTLKGSPIFNLCNAAREQFSQHLYWIPGNGRKIKMWDDSIMGDQPMKQVSDLANIKEWLQARNLHTLWDISIWKEAPDRTWDGWNLGEVPTTLQGEASLLLDILQGKSPSKANAKDKRGWGSFSGHYTVAEGYKRIMAVPHVPPNPAQWKFIWDFPALPKIDFFCWTVAHQSILTRDNLRRRGMEGPSRCPLCRSDEETTNHLLLLYPFAQEVWRGVLLLETTISVLPDNIPALFRTWASLSPFCLKNKNLLKTSWMWIPKFICWKLWLERNNIIFREESCTTIRVISKIKALLGEALEANATLRNETRLLIEEENWIKELVPKLKERPPQSAPVPSSWEIRLEEQEFIKWRSTLEEHCLFFDGASKGNPGVAGSGGVLLSPGGSPELRFHWVLGIETNNRAEALALWQGLTQAIKRNILSLAVFGDSRLIIQAMLRPKNSHQIQLASIIKKIRLLLPKFTKISFFHILRNLNSLADNEANLGVLCSRRSLGQHIRNVDKKLKAGQSLRSPLSTSDDWDFKYTYGSILQPA